MMTAAKTLRLRETLRVQIDRIARRSRRSFSEVTQDLLDEALRMRMCPGIYFADEPGGREAKVSGTGLGVWEVVMVHLAVDSDERRLAAQFPWLSAAQLKAAVGYYARHRTEVDDLIADNESVLSEVRQAGRHAQARRR